MQRQCHHHEHVYSQLATYTTGSVLLPVAEVGFRALVGKHVVAAIVLVAGCTSSACYIVSMVTALQLHLQADFQLAFFGALAYADQNKYIVYPWPHCFWLQQ